ncbi:hypothetical protein [Thioalkalivibrio sulfidiphilus]|uniref:hypothetical protein n=1 Tax=Thioalkalivibrio sulfidiphilus TaxID=1033854 RepID=UPI003B2B501C
MRLNQNPSAETPAVETHNIRFLNPYLMSGAEIRRLQVANGDTPCFGTEARYQCRRDDCQLSRRCLGGLVAHWKR